MNTRLKTLPVTDKLFGLDTLRALAILAVILYHFTIFGELSASILPFTYFGWMGVDLFFVLSGFLIGRQVLKSYLGRQRPSIKQFYRRRAYRILPAYLVVLLLYFTVPGWREFPRLAPLWKFLTFTTNFGFSFDSRAFSHAWSLCVEEQFYLLLPLILMLIMWRPSARTTVAVLSSIVIFGIGLRGFLITQYPDDVWTRIYYPSYTRLDGLVMGVSLAIVQTFRQAWWDRLMRHGHALMAMGCACVGCVMWMFRGDDLGNPEGPAMWGIVVGLPLLSFGLGLITASSVSKNGVLARARVPGMETVAGLAFSLYLTHKAVGHLLMEHLPKVTSAHGPASWLIYAVACFAVAWLLSVLVERPFLRLRDRSSISIAETASAIDVKIRREPAL